MAKGIYCLKIYLFQEQFAFTAYELQALRRICLFTVTLYVKAWFTVPSSCGAPLYDLTLLQSLESYKEVDSPIANIVVVKMKRHLWSEDLIGLALFSDEVHDTQKEVMVASIHKPPRGNDTRNLTRSQFHHFSRSHCLTLSLGTHCTYLILTEWI